MKPTAQSSQTQELIDLCLALAAHPAKLELLKGKAQTRLDEMHRAEDGFFAGIDAQGPEFYQRLRVHIDKVEESFRDYSEALEQILESNFDGQQVAQALANASSGLRVNMSSYEEAYLSEGDSRYPVVNLFRNTVLGVSEGRMARSLIGAVSDRYSNFYKLAIEEIEQSQARQKPGVSERKAAMQDILGIIAELRELPSGDALEPVLDRLTAAHVELDGAFDTYHKSEFLEGPAQGTRINLLVNAAEGVLDGKFQPAVLETMAQNLLDLTQHNLAEMKNLRRSKLDSEVLSEELERMVEAVEEIEDALLFLLEYAQGKAKNEEEVREAIDDLIDSGDALAESTEIVHQTGKVTCIQCQALQEKGARACVSCGATLPRQADEGIYGHQSSSFQVMEGVDPEQGEVMTDVMHALFQACEAFLAGKLPARELIARIDQNTAAVEKALASLDRLQTPALPSEANLDEQDTARNFIDLAEDALILLSQGAAECLKGLSTITRAAQADDLDSVRSGMRSYYEGTQKMWQVRRLERELDDYLIAPPSTN